LVGGIIIPRGNPLDIDIKSMALWSPTTSRRKRKPCPKAVKNAVWKKYNGRRMTGKCYVCGASITFDNFELGHNKPFSKGGKCTVRNLRPICRTCNRSMGTMTIEAFKRRYFSKKKKPKKKTKRKKTKRKHRNPFEIDISTLRL